MNLSEEANKDNVGKRADWNEEFDAQLKLIGDQLGSIRRVLYFIAVCTAVGAISACGLAYIFLRMLGPNPSGVP